MEFSKKKFKAVLNCAGKTAILFTLVGIVFSPLAQITAVPIAQAQSQPAISLIDTTTRTLPALYKKAGINDSCVQTPDSCTSSDIQILTSQFGYGPSCLPNASNPGTCSSQELLARSSVYGAVARVANLAQTVGNNTINQINSTPAGAQALAAASQTTAAAGANNGAGSSGGGDFGCGSSGFATNSEGFAVCVASLVYYIGPGLASNVAYVAAYFFSYTISLSLNSVAYALDFLSSGWTTVRDLANMAFILILVYIAFMIMFQAETTGTIRMLAWVIFIALIINFSFFLTRVVIDAGNILSVQFYNAIPQTATLNGTAGSSAFGGSGVKDLSASVMDAVGLQTLFSEATFKQAKEAGGNSIMGGLIILTLVYLSVAVMFWILFFVFLQVGIKFLYRVVVLWFIIISAPLALVAKAVPQESVKKYYDVWQSYLIKFSFYPVIFLFIYLIMVKFIQQMLMGQGGTLVSTLFSGQAQAGTTAAGVVNLSLAGAIANVSIRMGFIVAMFYIALKASDWIVQEGSNAASNITGRLTGAALGTVGLGGRIGSAALSRTTRDLKLNESKYAMVRGLGNMSNALSNRTFDLRNAPGVNRAIGAVGGDLVKGRMLDVGKGSTQTGAQVRQKAEDFENKVLGTVGDIKIREDARNYGKYIGYDIDGTEKRLGELDKLKAERNLRGSSLLGSEVEEYERLEKHKAAVVKKEGRSWDEIKNARNVVAKSVGGMSGAQLANLKSKDLEGILKHLSKNQIEAIKATGKHNAYETKELDSKWNEHAHDAPLNKARGELEALGKIHDELKNLGTSLDTMAKYAKPDPKTPALITTEGISLMKKEAENNKVRQEELKTEINKDRDAQKTTLLQARKEIGELKAAIEQDSYDRGLKEKFENAKGEEEIRDAKAKLDAREKEVREAQVSLKAKEEYIKGAEVDIILKNGKIKEQNTIINKLADAIQRVEKLATQTKEVPKNAGGHEDEGKFTHSA